MVPPRLILDNLACGHGERALFRDLSVTLEAGDVVRILGENGSGKTTLLRTVCGLHEPYEGRVEWQGGPVTFAGDDAPTLCDQLCFVGHDNALSGALTPIENLDVLMRLAGRRRSEKHIRQTLADLGLKAAAHRACERLSAGQRRRVSLARLWLTDAPLWLLDEPASALDVDARAVLSTRISAHAQQGGIVLFTTHEQLSLPGVQIRAIKLATC